MINLLSIYGASGHGKVIADMAREGRFTHIRFVDDVQHGSEILGYPVHPYEKENVEGDWIIAIGANDVRKSIAEKLGGVRFVNICHPSVMVSSTVQWGTGIVAMAGAIVNVDSSIGNHTILNTGCSIDHDCRVGSFVHIAPQVTLCGNVQVGDGTFIGAGSVVIPGITIGRNCIIGAGSVVIRNVPDNSKVAGSPARSI